jgi:hypothetical protein
LEDDVSLLLSTTGTPRYLGKELKSSLTSAEVRNVKSYIAIDDPHEGNVGKIVPLRDHLRSNQDVDLFPAHLVKHRGVVIDRFDRVSIELCDSSCGEKFRDLFKDPLGAGPPLFKKWLRFEVSGCVRILCSAT